MGVCVYSHALCVHYMYVEGEREKSNAKNKTKQNTKLNAVDHEDNMKP